METKTNKKPLHGICYLQMFLTKKQIKDLGDQRLYHEQYRAIFLKYFPKHIDGWTDNFVSKDLRTRVKHLKLIQKIPNDNHKVCCDGYWRLLLLNKRKNVKFFPQVYHIEGSKGYSKQSLQLLKLLPNVQNVELCLEPHPRFMKWKDEEWEKYLHQQLHWQKRMLDYLTKMACLKSLRLSNSADNLLPLFSKLNSSETMLKRWEVLQVYFSLSGPQGHRDFKELLNYKTVFKYMTHLKLEMPDQIEFFELLQLLPNYCPRLSSLSLEPQNPMMTLKDYRSLQSLQAFQNLQRLRLKTHAKLDVFTQCKLPSSLRHLDLCLNNVDWKFLKTDQNGVANSELVLGNKQEGLLNLKKLHLDFQIYDPQEGFALMKCFIRDFLKKILALKELNVKSCPQYVEGHEYLFDLSQFFQSLSHHHRSLETIIIDAGSRYKFINFKNNDVHFPNLSFLLLNGKEIPSETTAFKNLIDLIQTKSEGSLSCVNLWKLKITSCEAFLDLFRALKRIDTVYGKRVELVLVYLGRGDDDEDFEENFEKLKNDSRGLKNVFMEIQFPRQYPEFRYLDELKSLKYLFGNLNINHDAYYNDSD